MLSFSSKSIGAEMTSRKHEHDPLGSVATDHVGRVGEGGNTCKVTRDPGREETQLDGVVNML